MKDRAILAAWALSVATASVVHDPRALAAGIALAALAAGREAPRAARRALGVVLLFGGVVTTSWLAMAAWQGDPPLETAAGAVARINLRAFLLTFLTLGVLRRVDPARALAFSPALLTGATIATAQIRRLDRLQRDFRLAFESRSIRRATADARLRHAAATAGTLLTRALHESEEIALAMESRALLRGEMVGTGEESR